MIKLLQVSGAIALLFGTILFISGLLIIFGFTVSISTDYLDFALLFIMIIGIALIFYVSQTFNFISVNYKEVAQEEENKNILDSGF